MFSDGQMCFQSVSNPNPNNWEPYDCVINVPLLQREKNLGSRVALLPGKFFLSGKFFNKCKKMPFKKPIKKRKAAVKNIEYIRTVWKMSRQSGRFPDCLEDLQTVWKISRQSGRFPDSVEHFQTIWKIFGQYLKFLDLLQDFRACLGNALDSLEDFPKVWKILRQSGRFPDGLEYFQTVLKISQ